MPSISVIMPVYNGEKYLKESIESILNQTYSDFEFIIINDHSTDNTEQIIKSYKDARIRYLINESNLGVARSLNKGLALAQGNYIARMDADDISINTRFEKQISYLNNNLNIAVLGTGIMIFGQEIPEREYIFSATKEGAKADLFFNNPLAHPTVMIRKSLLKNTLYEPEYEGLEDYVLWWRIAQEYDIVSLPEPLLCYRKHKEQVTQSRSEDFCIRFRKFVMERINTLNQMCTENEVDLLYRYCIGDKDKFSEKDIHNFIVFLKKLIKANHLQKKFPHNELRYSCGCAVVSVVNCSMTKKKARLQLLTFAYVNGLMTTNYIVKVVIKSFLALI